MRLLKNAAIALVAVGVVQTASAATTNTLNNPRPQIIILNPPEKDFFSKELFFHGIPIKAHKVVSDEAMYGANDRISMMLSNLPMVVSNLVAAGVELHIIGRNQVTTDLPEWRKDKGKPIPEYNGLTRDQRTRGMGGRLTSCGEENLLKLKGDHYYGRDICIHEFAHAIYQYGVQQEVRDRIRKQFDSSLAKGLWNKAYAASNPN
jgi:alpha-glucosidase